MPERVAAPRKVRVRTLGLGPLGLGLAVSVGAGALAPGSRPLAKPGPVERPNS